MAAGGSPENGGSLSPPSQLPAVSDTEVISTSKDSKLQSQSQPKVMSRRNQKSMTIKNQLPRRAGGKRRGESSAEPSKEQLERTYSENMYLFSGTEIGTQLDNE